MPTDAERFEAWLKGTDVPTTSKRAAIKPAKAKQYGLLIEQYDGNPSCTDGKRRGFNGQQPREHDSSITSDCVVTTKEGHTYVLRVTRNRRELTSAERSQLATAVANKQRRIISSADLPAIGNIE